MSFVAEFAALLHKQESIASSRRLVPVLIEGAVEALTDIRVVIFDVYGTLINYWRPAFGNESQKNETLLTAFTKTMQRFDMADYFTRMNPADPPQNTLRDFYHGLIALKHDLAHEKGTQFPEIKIEDIWQTIILMLKRHGYDTLATGIPEVDLPKCMAYTYNFYAHDRGFFPGVAGLLDDLKKRQILCGIVSNAQFYTPIDLTLYLRDQSDDRCDDYLEFFSEDLIYYSYEYGIAKPDTFLLKKLYDVLYELHILPSQTVFVGNDLLSDVKFAQDAGMKTALFCGDEQSCFLHNELGSVVPDITFTSWEDFGRKISFYEKPVIAS